LGKAWMGETVFAAAVFAEQAAHQAKSDEAAQD
jgi:hypothetical protein